MKKQHIFKILGKNQYIPGFLRNEIHEEAIKDNGIYSTFERRTNWNYTFKRYEMHLYYYKWEQYDSWELVYKKIFYKDCPEIAFRYKDHPELSDMTSPYICAEVLQNIADRIKMDVAKIDDAIWSTIKIEPYNDHFLVKYAQASDLKGMIGLAELRNKVYAEAGIKAAEESLFSAPRYLRSDCMVVNSGETLQGLEPKEQKSSFASGKPMTAQELEIENTKRTLRRVQEACDHAAKCLGFVDTETLRRISEKFSYGSHNKEEKEKKDMNVTLMVVPNGMNKDFVNKVKADFQSNTSRLFVASTDIDYSCEYEPIKTKYDLFEHWIKTGKVDVVYFMLGFEKDPDARAFEAFVRGFTEAEVPGKIDIRVAYQKDDIVNDMNSLRTLYFDEADAKEDLQNAGDKVIKEAMKMCDVYGLNGKYLEAIKNSKGRIDASEEFVMGKIMDTAFISDEDAKPAKKGGKK